MMNRALICTVIAGSMTAATITGCDSLPGNKRTQGAVIGGAGGAVAGAVLAKGNPVLGALIGGALGAGGGYLVGVQMEHADKKDVNAANQSVQNAQTNPATADQARQAPTADINGDGFVTLDEVIAMDRAGFSDDEMIRRLQATGQIFSLTPEQKDYLVGQGVSRRVADAMDSINKEQRDRILSNRQDVISQPH